MTLIDEYDSVTADLVGVVRLTLDGRPGAAEEARRILCDGDETLSGRMRHLRDRIELVREKAPATASGKARAAS